MIYAYDYDMATGEVRSRRVFASFENQRGLPDGATVDAEGYVWSCEVYSGRLVRFDPDGVVDRIVGLPVQSATSVIFGGPNLDIAYVTSMARPYNGDYHREREAGMRVRHPWPRRARHRRNHGSKAETGEQHADRSSGRREDDPRRRPAVGCRAAAALLDRRGGMRVFRATHRAARSAPGTCLAKIGSIAIRKDGKGAICSLANGFHALDFETGESTLIAEIEPDRPNNWINDGKVDRSGRFFAGSMDSQESAPTAPSIGSIRTSRSPRSRSKIIVSNGPCWSPDDKIFYFADSWSGEIWAYDYDISDRLARQPPHLRQGRHVEWRRRRWLDGRCRGLPVECPGL